MKYAVYIERAGEDFSTYVPNLPVCITTGVSTSEVEQLIREAISFHLEDLWEHETETAQPSCDVDYAELAA